jgi:hypothetical protein
MTSTVERLRGDIDSGRTRDKVAGPDPATVPLGADEEAAGTPVSKRSVDLTRSQEVDGPARSNEDGGSGTYLFAVAALAILFIGAAAILLR